MKNIRRVLSGILLVTMVITALPLSSFAAYENTHTNTGNQIEDLIAVANTQIGYTEGNSTAGHGGTTGGSGNYTKYGAWYGINPGAWCAMFVSWCANQAGISSSIIPKHASCDIGMQWFQSNGKWQWSKALGGTYTPKRGDIIYFRTNTSITHDSTHVGIVTSCSGSNISTVEGNASNKCQTKSYNVSSAYILGYGTPAYTSGAATYAPGTYRVTASSLNMRSTAGTDGSIVQVLTEGTQVTVTAVSGRWGYCVVNGKAGWVSLAYCILVSGTTYYTLTLDPNGGTQTSGQSSYAITVGTQYSTVMGSSLPQAKRSGYDFGGWYCADFNYTLRLTDTYGEATDSTFVAVWTAKLGNYTITTNTDPLNMRKGPGSSEDVVTKVPKGTIVNITTINGDWGYCTYNGYSGWVSLAYCTYHSAHVAPDEPSVTETYTLTFNPNGGTMPSGYSTTYQFEYEQRLDSVIPVLPVPTHPDKNKEFAGWYWDKAGPDSEGYLFNGGWGTQIYIFWNPDNPSEIIDATFIAKWVDHSHSYSSTVTRVATCVTTGIRTYICDSCGDTYTESIATTAHTYTSALTKAATCTSDGIRTYTCSACGSSYTESIAKTGHSYTVSGLTASCIYCGGAYTGFCNKNNNQYYAADGKVQTGVFKVDGYHYYASGTGVIAKDGVVNITAAEKNGLLSDCGDSFYEIGADGRITVTGFVTKDGVTRYYDNTVLTKGFTKIGADFYYFESNGNMAVNTNKEVGTNSYGITPGSYYFLTDGRMYRDVLGDFDILNENGKKYLYVDGAVATAGMYTDGSDYYYVKGDGTLACDETIYTYYSEILTKAYYRFRSDCTMQKDGWLDLGDGRVYYFEGGSHAEGLRYIDGDYYFFYKNKAERCHNVDIWVSANPYRLNEGSYRFGADGKMVVTAKAAAPAAVESQAVYVATNAAVAEQSGIDTYTRNTSVLALNAVAPTLEAPATNGEDDE